MDREPRSLAAQPRRAWRGSCFASWRMRAKHKDSRQARDSPIGMLWNIELARHQSGFRLANYTTLPHFSVSSAMSLLNSDELPPIAVPPKSAIRAFILESAKAALISLFSLPTISVGVFLGAPRPN